MPLIPALLHRRIAHRPNLVKIVDNIGWLFFDKVLRMGVGVFVGVWIARYLGPEQFGLLSFATAFIGLFGAIATLGLQGIVVRDIVRDPASKEKTLGTAAALLFVGGLISYSLILATIFWLRADDTLAKAIVAILGSIMLFKVSEVAVYWFESQVLSKYTVWVQNGVFLVFAAVKVGLILQGAPLIAFAWAMMAEVAVVAILLLVMLGLRGPRLRQLSVSAKRAKILLADSWPLLLSGIAIVIYMKIDQIMLGQMIGDEAVGIYSVAVRLSEIWYLIPTIIVASVFPALTKSHRENQPEFFARLQRLYGNLVKLAIVIAIIVTLLSSQLINLIFGSPYRDSAGVLSWHIWGSIFVFFGVAWSKWIVLEGLQRVSATMHLMSLIANILLNLMLIPSYGSLGAAAATTISYGLGHSLFMFIFPSQRIAVMMFWRSFY
jgi:O-antigen/teichoic acid export membrane protein